MKTMSSANTIVIAISVLIIVGTAIFFMSQRQGPGSFIIEVGKNKMSLDFSDNNKNVSELIKKFLDDEKYKQDTLAILNSSYGLYQVGSDELIDKIRRESGDSEFSKKIRELLRDKKGPFEQQYHTHYDITDPAIVNEIKNMDYDHEVAKKLRRLKDNEEGIFKLEFIDASVEANQTANGIDEGFATICKSEDSDQYNQRNLVILSQYSRSEPLEVFVKGTPHCLTFRSVNKTPQIFLNKKDMERLLGDNDNTDNKIDIQFYLSPRGYHMMTMVLDES